MHTKFLAKTLSKQQVRAFLGYSHQQKLSKEQLVALLVALIDENQGERWRLLTMFPSELAVGPTELENLLHCSAAERKRWVKDGKLAVLEYRTFRKAGKDLHYPVHDRRMVIAISQEEIAQWRQEYQDQIQQHRRLGVQLAVERRKINQQQRQQFQLSWQEMITTWTTHASVEVAQVLQLAYWTCWASRWAKENHLKGLHSSKHMARYQAQRDAWYARKNEAMQLLYHTPFAKLSFYRPENPDKMVLSLCDEHYEEKIDGFYEDKWDFYEVHKATINACPQCFVAIERDYYALYYLEITTAHFPELRFSFHMPYPIGRALFPTPKKVPKVEHVEQDGVFRFGRTLFPLEKITHRESDVLTQFAQALQATLQLDFTRMAR